MSQREVTRCTSFLEHVCLFLPVCCLSAACLLVRFWPSLGSCSRRANNEMGPKFPKCCSSQSSRILLFRQVPFPYNLRFLLTCDKWYVTLFFHIFLYSLDNSTDLRSLFRILREKPLPRWRVMSWETWWEALHWYFQSSTWKCRFLFAKKKTSKSPLLSHLARGTQKKGLIAVQKQPPRTDGDLRNVFQKLMVWHFTCCSTTTCDAPTLQGILSNF